MPRSPFRVPLSAPAPLRVLALLVLAALLASPALAASVSWDGGGDGLTWGNALNWSGDVVPTAADDVLIGSGATVRVAAAAAALSLDCDGTLQVQSSLSLGSASSVSVLQHTTGTLTVAGDLTIGTSLTWSGGTMTGAGTTILAPGATGTLSTATLSLLTRAFRNEGSIVWTSANLSLSTSATFTNAAGASFEIAGNLTMTQVGTGNLFRNDGTVRRTTTTGTATILVPFSNGIGGLVRGETGTMRFSRALANSGQFEFLPGTVLETHNPDTNPALNPKTFDATSSLVAETFQVGANSNQHIVTVSGSYDVEHTIVSFGAAAMATTAGLFITHPDTLPRLTLGTPTNTGRLDVTGDLLISESFLWQGLSYLQGSGTALIPAGVTATLASGGTGDLTVDMGRTLRNESNAIWTSGTLRMLNGALFHNASGGTFEIRGDLTMEGTATGATPGSFRNDGTVRRTTTAGTATVLATFVNGIGGLVRGETGTMRFSRTLVNSGQFEFLPGTVLETQNPDTNPAFNPKTFDATSSLVAETFQVGANSNQHIVTVSGSYDVEHTIVSFGAAAMATTAGLYITHPDTLPQLTLGTPTRAARLDVTGDLLISESFLWQGLSYLQGSGTALIPAGVTATLASGGTGDLTVDMGRTLRNESNAIWTSGTLRMLNAGLFHNAPGGTFEIRGDLTMEGTATGATPGSFRNDGTVRRTTTSGTATVLATFVNGTAGLFRGETGTVRFSRTLVNSGRFEFLPGAVLETHNPDTNPAFNPKTFDATSSLVAETFRVGVELNQHVVSVSGNYDVLHTVVSFSGGSSLAATAGLYITHPDTLPRLTLGTPTRAARLNVTGDVRISEWLLWQGFTSYLEGVGTATIAPTATATISGSTTGTTLRLDTKNLRNEGVATWTTGGFGVRNGSTIDNPGTFLVRADAKMSRVDGTLTHYFNNSGTVRREVSAGTAEIDGGICFVNSGIVDVDTGTLLFSGCYPALTGTYNVASTLKINSVPVPDCSDADIVLETAGAQVLDASGLSLVGHLDCIQPAGSITVQGGKNYLTDGPMSNSGTLEIDPGSALTVNGAYTQLAGTTNVEDGTLTATLIDIVGGVATAEGLFDGDTRNAGRLEVGAPIGRLDVDGAYTQTGTGVLALEIGGTVPVTEYDQLHVAGLATFGGTLEVALVNGFLPASGDSFHVVLYGSYTGAFSTLALPPLPAGLEWGAEYGVTELTLYVKSAEFTIASSAGAGGTISPAGASTVLYEGSAGYMIAPDTCYQVADVLVDGASVGAMTEYIFSGVLANHTIAATFSLLSYTITASAVVGGAISPAGANSVACGTDHAFTITPNVGYDVIDVLVDGASVGPVAGYTFSGVGANHTIEATFALNSHTIAAAAGTGGSISPTGVTAVVHGANQTVAIEPDSCHQVADILVDGASVGAVLEYTFSDVQVNHTIEATFALLSYTITASAGPGGAILPSGAEPVACGDGHSVTITPEAGYVVQDVLVDGASVGSVTAYNFTDVQASHTIAVAFTPDSPTEVTVHGVVIGDCGGPLHGVTVDLLDAGGGFHTTTTDDAGAYSFAGIPSSSEANAGEVSIVVPLGYQAVTPGPVGQAITLDQDREANFLVACLDPTGAPRGMGYWKHNANVYLSGHGSAQESSANMTAQYPQAIFNHFHENTLNGIAVQGVTYIGNPPQALDLATISATLTVNRGGTTLDRAKQHYLALLLNVASGKLLTSSVVSQDGATASQTLQYIADLILDGNMSNDGLAQSLGETVNNALLIAAGVVPLTDYDSIAYARRQGATLQLRVMENPSGLGAAEFQFAIPQPGRVELEVFDVQGRRIAAPVSDVLGAGVHRIKWDGRVDSGAAAAAGVYFGRLTTSEGTQTITFQRLRQ